MIVFSYLKGSKKELFQILFASHQSKIQNYNSLRSANIVR